MDKSNVLSTNRRDFITRIVPGCVLSCFGSQYILASAPNGKVPLAQEDQHKFQSQMDRKIAYKQWMQQRHRKYIGILKHLEREEDALDLGYACVCHADFGLPVGINPKLKLIRTKTLMQGHDCCNHRYVWEG